MSTEFEKGIQVIDEAIRAGKFPKSRRNAYVNAMARDPKGTTKLIASLTPAPELAGRETPPNAQRGPIASDAGRRIEPAMHGGYRFPTKLEGAQS